jgi:hypothetical protein
MSDADLLQQSETSLRAASSTLQEMLRQELAGLRQGLDKRVETFEAVIGQTDSLINRLGQDLSHFARANAEQAATQARRQAEELARQRLDAARAVSDAELAGVRDELEAARAALQAHMTDAQEQRAEAAAALAEAQEEIAEMRRQNHEQAVRLDEARRRISVLEEDALGWTLSRQVADAHLEEERQRRRTIVTQLEAAREELRLANAEATCYRLEAHQLADRLQRIEAAHGSVASGEPIQPPSEEQHLMLDTLRKGLEALSSARTADEMLRSLLDSLSQLFPAVAMFAAGADGFKLSRSRGNELDANLRLPTIPLESASPLSRALQDRTTVTGDAASGEGPLPLGERRVGPYAALPLLASQRVIAVAYVENPKDRFHADVALFTKVAEILTDRINQRLQRAQTPTSMPSSDRSSTSERQEVRTAAARSPQYAVARQAARVPIHEGVKVLVDGFATSLVDLSTLGAQIVSPRTLNRNHPVRITLSADEGLSYKGRIVWTRAEQTGEDAAIRYRAGLQFTEADAAALKAFVAQYGVLGLPSGTVLKH